MESHPSQSNSSSNFPKGFLWGSATASYQVEGGIENNDWAKAGREGKVPPAGISSDHYNRYEKDFDIAQSLSQNTHRLSIEWARIEPHEGQFDEKEIEHYRRVIQSLKRRGLEPFVTLWHFTLPIWFADKGGFENEESPKIFARYCKYVVSKLGDEAEFWMTINEPLIWASGSYFRGKWPPFKKNIFKFIRVQSSLVESHTLAFKSMKEINSNLKIGIAKNNMYFGADNKVWNIIAKNFMNWFWNERFLDKISGHQDFIGLNHYFYVKFGDKDKLPKTDMNWDIFPEAIYKCLVQLKKYNKPIYITENGIADEKDVMRGDFIKDYLKFVKKAIDEGVDVKGYFHWSLLDNFEWSFGFDKKFGLVEIVPKTLERKIRSSAYIYKKIAENNSIV